VSNLLDKIYNKVERMEEKIDGEMVSQAEFRGRTDAHFVAINSRLGKVEMRTEDIDNNTSVWQWAQRNPKVSIFIVLCVVSVAFGIPLLVAF